MITSSGEQRLISTYGRFGPDSFALFLGAGINREPEKEATPRGSWPKLLESLYAIRHAGAAREFDDVCSMHGGRWIDMASEVIGPNPDIEELVLQIDSLIHHGVHRGDTTWKQLEKGLLTLCPSLRAAIAFCARIRDPSFKMSFRPNIGAVVTSNYDFFFGAGWNRYQSFSNHWEIWTPKNGSQWAHENGGSYGRRPIFYIHGYVPYALRVETPEGIEKVRAHELVIRREDYEGAYGAIGFARRVLAHVVDSYHLLFVGVSFEDDELCRAISESRVSRERFALCREDQPQTIERLQNLGVTPVCVQDFRETPDMLCRVYCSSVDENELNRVDLGSPEAYWQHVHGALLRKHDRPLLLPASRPATN